MGQIKNQLITVEDAILQVTHQQFFKVRGREPSSEEYIQLGIEARQLATKILGGVVY